MREFLYVLAFGISSLILTAGSGYGADRVRIDQPMSPPNWALLERELLRANTAACREFFHQYFDERGFLLCIERWGGDDGPDDAIENLIHWPVLHALGAPDSILKMYKKGWEGHLRQYTLAKTVEVPFARDGMYYKEFPVMFDWLHHAEGLTVFCLQGLSDPYDAALRKRARRFAGFYMGEDPQARNYDPQHKIIRSMFNWSRGPLLRKATALDWAGDPIEVEHRFLLAHGEKSYEEVLAHFKDYNDVAGDHPSNLLATALALNAYMLDHDPKYKQYRNEHAGGRRGLGKDIGHGQWIVDRYDHGLQVVRPWLRVSDARCGIVARPTGIVKGAVSARGRDLAGEVGRIGKLLFRVVGGLLLQDLGL